MNVVNVWSYLVLQASYLTAHPYIKVNTSSLHGFYDIPRDPGPKEHLSFQSHALGSFLVSVFVSASNTLRYSESCICIRLHPRLHGLCFMFLLFKLDGHSRA